jgi:hypothetical protein
MDRDLLLASTLRDYAEKVIDRVSYYNRGLTFIFMNRKCTKNPETGAACGERLDDKCAWCIAKHFLGLDGEET